MSRLAIDSCAAAAAANLMGRLVQLESLGLLGDQGMSLFSDAESIAVCVPELGVDVHGPAEVAAFLRERGAWRGRGKVHLLHSAAYRMEDETHLRGHWNTYSFCLQQEGAAGQFHSVRFSYLRFCVDFRKERNGWRILRLDCRRLLSVDPWDYTPELESAVLDCPDRPSGICLCDGTPCPNGEDYVALRNLTGMFCHNGPLKAKRYFAKQDPCLDIPTVIPPAQGYDAVCAALDEWERLERENGLYLTVQMGTSPVFKMIGADSACGSVLALCIDTKGRLFGYDCSPYPTVFRLAMLCFDYTREADGWKIRSVTQKLLANMDPVEQRISSGKRIVMMEQENRICVREYCKEGTATDVFAVESILPEWTERLKRSDLPDFKSMYMDNGQRDLAIVLSRGYFGAEAVAEHCETLINSFVKKYPTMKKYPQFHTGNTPVIEISADGKHAVAAWFDFGWGNIGAGVLYDDTVKERNYFPGVGKYYHSFIKENGEWKMYRLGWYPLMGDFTPWSYRVGETGGWASMETDAPWPLPLQDAAW